MKGETLTYLLLCEDYGFRTNHGFVNKFLRRLKLSGLDLPYRSPKPRVIFYSKMSNLRLCLEQLKASQPLTGMSLFITPTKGRGGGCSGTAIVLPEPVQFGKELALVKEPVLPF